MFSIGTAELVVILVIALFAVGPAKLPEAARMLAKFLNYLKQNLEEFGNTVRKIADEDRE